MVTPPAQTERLSTTDQLLQFATGYMISASINTVARLKIPDLLRDGERHVNDLARTAQVNEDALYRVLRALASVGIFMESPPHTFVNTPISEKMRTGTPDSIRDMVLWISDPFHFRAYAELMHSIETGNNVSKRVTGMEIFDYFQQDEALAHVFNAAMTGFSAMMIPAVLEVYDFGPLGTLADIAGGHGRVITGILEKHVDVQGILFDLPHVCTGARTRIEETGLASRCQIVGGDFFQSVPTADSYVMKHIIHDWDDERAVQILKNCAAAMRGKGKVILIESVIAPGNDPHLAKWIDLEMLILPSGRERTEEEFAELFSQAGLQLSRVIPTKSPVSVIEAVKI